MTILETFIKLRDDLKLWVTNNLKAKADTIRHKAGSTITIQDAAHAPIKGLRIFGKTEQVEFTGKNLLDIGNNRSFNKNGVKLTISDNGITASGTPTATFIQYLCGGMSSGLKLPAGNYILTGGVNSTYCLRVKLYGADGTSGKEQFETGNGFSFTLQEGEGISVALKVGSTDPIDEVLFQPMIRDASIMDDTYEPYVDGHILKLTPIGANGETKINIAASDEFYEWFTTNAVEQKKLSGTWRFNDVLTQGYFPNDINGYNEVYIDYQVEAVVNGESVTLYCTTIYQEPYTGQPGVGSLQYVCASSRPDFSALGITYPFGRYIYDGGVGTWDTAAFGEGIQTITFTEEQTVSPEFYEWFTANAVEVVAQSQTLTVSTSNGLYGIKSLFGNYVDESGQHWICDEKDFTNGLSIQRIGVIESYIDEEITTEFVSTKGGLVKGAKVIYILPEPIETALPEDELSNYTKLHTYSGCSLISNDDGAYMEVSYYTPSTAVQMVHSPADSGKVLSIDEHGCVVLTEPNDVVSKEVLNRTVYATPETLTSVIASALPNTTIILNNGNYDLLTLKGINSYPENLTLIGSNKTKTILNGISITSGVTDFEVNTIYENNNKHDCSNGDISNAIMPKGLTIRNITFANSFCLRNCGVDNLTIRDCIFNLEGYISIEPNRMLDLYGKDYSESSHNFETRRNYARIIPKNLVIRDCTFAGTTGTRQTIYGDSTILVKGVENVVIYRNIINQASFSGITVGGVSKEECGIYSTGRIIITNNTISNTNEQSINLYALKNADVTVAVNKLSKANLVSTENPGYIIAQNCIDTTFAWNGKIGTSSYYNTYVDGETTKKLYENDGIYVTVKNNPDLLNHLADKNNPHEVTAPQIGIGDYILTQGTSDSWIYRIYASGIGECLFTKTLTYNDLSSNSALYEDWIQMPFNFIRKPHILSTINSSNWTHSTTYFDVEHEVETSESNEVLHVDVLFNYNSVNNNQNGQATLTVKCVGEYVEVIDFLVDSYPYKAYKDMTWGSWCSAEHLNIDGYYVENSNIKFTDAEGTVYTLYDSNGNLVSADSHIIPSEIYRKVISFTIADIEYKAYSGMTWKEWVKSDFNTGSFYTGNYTHGESNYGCNIEVEDGNAILRDDSGQSGTFVKGVSNGGNGSNGRDKVLPDDTIAASKEYGLFTALALTPIG